MKLYGTIEGEFVKALYLDSSKSLIEATFADTEEIRHQVIIPTDLENEMYVALLEKFTTDEISTMTDQEHKIQELVFTNFVKKMALDYGLVYDPNAAEGGQAHSVDHIFEPPEGDEGTDLLFNVKLKIFDMPEVVDSTNDDLKKELREADTPLKAMYIAGKFLFE